MIPGLNNIISSDLQRLANGKTGTTVTYLWRTPDGGLPGDYDPNDESTHPTGWTEHESTFAAIVHLVTPTSSGYQRFAEVQAGDIILDYPPDPTLFDGKDDLRFKINGEIYVQKHAGKKLAESWDVTTPDGALFSTLLLTRA